MENLITTNMSVSELTQDFEAGDIAVPEIQRDVVWKPEQVKQLIDSINQRFPCGSLILWEPRDKDKNLVRSILRPERLTEADGRLPRYFLLDGQQRVTALASVMLKRDKLKRLLTEVEEEMPLLFVNVKHIARDIEVTTDPSGYKFPWLLMNSLFDGSPAPEIDGLSAKEKDGIRRYVQKVRDYQFPVQIIRERDYGTVGEIFTRVNSQGTQLTGAEIHLARIVPHWRGITSEFRNYRKDLRQKRYDLDLTFLMRAITVVECSVPRIKKLAERISKDNLSRRHLDKTWRQARQATDNLIRILKRDLLLDKSKFFTSKNALVPPVYCLAAGNNSRSANRDLLRFFVFSQLGEHYGGGAESALARDFRTLVGDARSIRDGLQELVGVVRQEAKTNYRALKIKPTDVSGLPSKNVLLLLMYAAMRKRGATDWGAPDCARLHEIEPADTQLHHVFPFNFMINNKAALAAYEKRGLNIRKFREDVNDIANLTFLSQSTNCEIGDLPPLQYLPNETTAEMRRAHFIPEDKGLWQPEKFFDFLKERRKLLSKGINSVLRGLT